MYSVYSMYSMYSMYSTSMDETSSIDSDERWLHIKYKSEMTRVFPHNCDCRKCNC